MCCCTVTSNMSISTTSVTFFNIFIIFRSFSGWITKTTSSSSASTSISITSTTVIISTITTTTIATITSTINTNITSSPNSNSTSDTAAASHSNSISSNATTNQDLTNKTSHSVSRNATSNNSASHSNSVSPNAPSVDSILSDEINSTSNSNEISNSNSTSNNLTQTGRESSSGTNSNQSSNEVSLLITNNATSASSAANNSNFESPRKNSAMGYCASYLYLFGGNGHAKKGELLLNDFYAYNISTEQWMNLKTRGDISTPRDRHSLTVIDNKIFIFGGSGSMNNSNDKSNEFLNDLFMYNLLLVLIFVFSLLFLKFISHLVQILV